MPPVARIGTEFAGYRIEALVGRGGTSTVYRAEKARLGIRVALKILNPEVAEDEAFRERFVRESQLAASIGHPNIITIYDAGVWEESLYIAMRYVAGGDLKERVREGPLVAERALSILAQVASGLDAAHARGLVHRDVKPANIMVDSGPGEEAPEIAYVSDFGLIKQVQTGARATPTGEFLGTISYVAPEQIEGRPVGPPADVYSLGCVAYECFTGRVPYVRENDAAVLWAHMQEEPPRATVSRTDLPPAVDDVLARAMAKDPSRRFESCSKLVQSLREAVTPALSRERSRTIPLARPRRREGGHRRTDVVRPLAIGLAGIALGAGGAVLAGAITDEEASPAARTPAGTTTVTQTVQVPRASRLLGLVPEPFRRACKAARPPTPDFDESVVCRPGKGVAVVRYSHALSGPLLSDYLIRRAQLVGAPEPDPGERLAWFGSCDAEDLPAIEEWTASGRAGHDAIGRTPLGDSDGRVICQATERSARVEWTTSRLGVYAFASGRRFRTVYAWWLNQAGPLR
ncbi:MAG TPA: serine/threonine-protein kinase [Gaiellaceae bacterium]|nr:serine/threonine-protein kinase [Gaiellaceae bacterium]